jgi:anti-sigma B factor antagonist
MSQDIQTDVRVDQRGDLQAVGRPQLRVRTIERTAILRFRDAEILFEEADIQPVAEQLERLIRDGGYARLVLNFRGVRYVSSTVLGVLARLQGELGEAGGSIQLCGLDPLLQDMMRMAHLDGLFEVCETEPEALGLLIY